MSVKVSVSHPASNMRISMVLTTADYGLLPNIVGVQAQITDLLTGTKHILRRTSTDIVLVQPGTARNEGLFQ
jgi:hypothetical protein